MPKPPARTASPTASSPAAKAFTVETFARYFIHDPVHHLYDVTGARPNG